MTSLTKEKVENVHAYLITKQLLTSIWVNIILLLTYVEVDMECY